jgi:Mg-chelatase subunit ChlD
MRFIRFVTIFLFLFFLAVPSPFAQNPKAKDKSAKKDSTETRLRVSFQMETLEGQPNQELKADDLKITEDTLPQKVHSIDQPNQAVSYGLIIDTSASMKEYLPAAKILTFSLISLLGNDDEMSVVAVHSYSEMIQELTSNKQALADSLKQLNPSGPTALLYREREQLELLSHLR